MEKKCENCIWCQRESYSFFICLNPETAVEAGILKTQLEYRQVEPQSVCEAFTSKNSAQSIAKEK